MNDQPPLVTGNRDRTVTPTVTFYTPGAASPSDAGGNRSPTRVPAVTRRRRFELTRRMLPAPGHPGAAARAGSTFGAVADCRD
jgi:hypothetical protein